MSLKLFSRLFRSTSINFPRQSFVSTANFSSSAKRRQNAQFQDLIAEMGKRSRENDSEKVTKRAKHSDKHDKSANQPETRLDAKESSEKQDFEAYRISKNVVKLLKAKGITQLFPIQSATFDHIYDGHDVLARARTGTGKTMAFALPIVERLLAEEGRLKRGRAPRALVMAPTRELALQVAREFEAISGDLSVACVYGGVAFDQQNKAFQDGVDICVGTPGRIQDHIERSRLWLGDLRFVVMDEADQMLDIGFKDDMDKILKDMVSQKQNNDSTTSQHQILLFSATVPEWVQTTCQKYMRRDMMKRVDLVTGSSLNKTAEKIRHLAIPARWQDRADVIADLVVAYGGGKEGRVIVFCETKMEANQLVLHPRLSLIAQAIHGDVSQAAREVTLNGFRESKFGVLVATNVAARGLDIPAIDCVINCEPPESAETYIHRSGRTGRANRSGTCITLYKPGNQDYMISNIEQRAGLKMVRPGVPQPTDIVRARAIDALRTIRKEVTEDALGPFMDVARVLLRKYASPQLALAATLAAYTGHTKPLLPRSLITAEEGWVTLQLTASEPMDNTYIRNFFRGAFPSLAYEDTKRPHVTKDGLTAVVDMHASHVHLVFDKESSSTAEDAATDDEADALMSLGPVVKGIKIAGKTYTTIDGVAIELCKTLPELPVAAAFGNAGARRGGYSGRGASGGRGYGGSGGRFTGKPANSYGGKFAGKSHSGGSSSNAGYSRGGKRY